MEVEFERPLISKYFFNVRVGENGTKIFMCTLCDNKIITGVYHLASAATHFHLEHSEVRSKKK
jgi:hypothetical protein